MSDKPTLYLKNFYLMFKFLYKVREKCVILCVQEGEKMIDIFKELDKKFNLINICNNLCDYVSKEKPFISGCQSTSFIEIFEDMFHFWPLNKGYNNLDEMLIDIGIKEEVDYPYQKKYGVYTIETEEQCYKYLQFLKNAVEFARHTNKGSYCSNYELVYEAILAKIDFIMNKLNMRFVLNNNEKYYKITENKPLVREIASKSNEEIAIRLYDYNAIENKNNLEKKKEILVYLATITEPITKSYNKKIKSGDIHDLYHILDFALNNLHIRHDNKTGTKKKEYVANLPDEELIKIYDQVYDLILEVLSIEYAKDSLSALTEVKDKFDKKNLS